MEHAFGREAPFALGIEEELLLVHPATLRLAGGASDLVARVTAAAGAVAEDVYQALIEVSTPVVGSAAEGHDALAALRDELRAAGATLLGAGLHPDGAFGDVEHIVSPRYEAIRADMRGLLARTPTAALHVHVGMPDPETAIDVCNRLRAHLPLLQALAAHSPYWHGRDSGFASARSMLFRGFPRAIIPPAFAGWEHYADFVGWWEQTADVPDCTYLWWDLRPSPRLGTVEVRAMDAQSRLGSSGGHRRPRARAGAGVRGRPRGAHAPVGGAHRILVPGRARRRRRHRVVARRPPADARGRRGRARAGAPLRARARRRGRARGGRAHPARGRRGDRMRAAHAAGGMDGMLARLAAETTAYSSTQTTSPSRSQS